jgi:predicted nucleic acid-binding protein
MILLDTIIVSQFIRSPPDPAALGWVKTLPVTEIGITTVQAAEILKGQARLPAGQRRDLLLRAYHSFLVNLPRTQTSSYSIKRPR